MPNMKTAISIDQSLFEQMDSIAKKANVPRSRLFAIAAQEFIERHQNEDLLKSINEAYHDVQKEEQVVTKMRAIHREIVRDQW